MAVMDLFVNKLGWEASYIAKNPSFSSYSLEKRLIPRASVLQFLVSKGLVEKSFRSLAFFNTPEDKFRQMYIDHHAESAQILKFYEEKLNLSGFSSPGHVKIISSYPWILKGSLEDQIVPAFDFLENLLQSDAVEKEQENAVSSPPAGPAHPTSTRRLLCIIDELKKCGKPQVALENSKASYKMLDVLC
ncbi:hypothetical protein OIU76_028965 [Salix suchowensis]|nr:hypothetical protein OIU76_028965 [Salix suchowensis]